MRSASAGSVASGVGRGPADEGEAVAQDERRARTGGSRPGRARCPAKETPDELIRIAHPLVTASR